MTKTKVNLGVVQETLLIPLYARAIEQQKVDPIIFDPKSAEIVEAIDYDFTKFATATSSQIGACLRGLIFDEWVNTYLKQYPQGSIVEIGVGLNTRFERVDNGLVRWFELDLQDAIALRRHFFHETERRKFIAASVLETDWIENVQATVTEPCLFIAEGVLIYFSEQQVKQLFTNLLENFPGSWFAFDFISPLFVKNQKKHAALKQTSAKVDWGISDIRKITDWNSQYQVTDVRTFKDLPDKYLKRFPLIVRLLFSYIPPLCNSYGLTLVKLG